MVRTTPSVLACLLPARFGFHKHQEKRAELVDEDPFRVCRDSAVFVSRSRANTAPSHLSGDIGESPHPAARTTSPVRQKRATFFAFSSKKKPNGAQRDVLSPESIQGRWMSAHLVNTSTVPSPLRTDDEEYYYSYAQDNAGPHPYAYSTPLCSRPQSKTTASLSHATTHQTFQLPPSDLSPTLVYSGVSSSHHGHSTTHGHPKLKTSVSTPNLAAGAAPMRARSLTKKRPSTRSKGQERWLSAETWWDALLSPSPRFKVRQAPRPHTATGGNDHHSVSKRSDAGPSKTLGVAFPSISSTRPRAVSAISNARPTVTVPTLARSRSATDLGQPLPRPGFEPALETLADERVPTPGAASSRNSALLSLEQVLDEGQAFEQQRAKWKRQATQSIGNKRTRSFSRARSKSLSEKHVHGHPTPESGKVHFNLEVLAARSLLGSQSTMPTVHVVRPSSASTHSKAYSHSHSHNSHTHSSHSRSYSHSHSLTTSNSSKSSRNPRCHSRSGSWSRTALLKAGALCGISQDESYTVTDEKVPPSSRADLQGVIHISAARTSDPARASPSPDATDEVGIAVSSSPTPALYPRRAPGDRETLRSSRPSHKSSEYAGPHPSAIITDLPQLAAASTVSLRHRLPPRAIYPPISPIDHPYGTASAQPQRSHDKSKSASLKATESGTEHTNLPHISLSHADFEQYGVGEALVYASLPRSVKTKSTDIDSEPPPHGEPEEQSFETVVFQCEESDTASMAVTSPSVTNSTIQMVVSAFNNPDDLDEFQDLFYRPLPAAGDGEGRPALAVGVELPMDVRSSASSSPLMHLVRKLSEEVHRGSFTPSDTAQRAWNPSSENVPGGIVFVGMARSASPPPAAPGSLQAEETKRVLIPEDVGSVYTASMLEQENDTFGYPIKHGHLEAVIAPSPTRTSVRVSMHPSIAEAMADPQPEPEAEAEDAHINYLSPAPRRPGIPTQDALRSSAVTTISDVSRVSMSGLYDFPLPPSTRPGEEPVHGSVLHSYFDATASESASEVETRSRSDNSEEEEHKVSGDVGEALHALRAERVASYDSRRTFGENDDPEFVTEQHLAGS